MDDITFETLNVLISKYTRPLYLVGTLPNMFRGNEVMNTFWFLQQKQFSETFNAIFVEIELQLKSLQNNNGRLLFQSEINDDIAQVQNTLEEHNYYVPKDEIEAIKLDNFLRGFDFKDPKNADKSELIIEATNILVATRYAEHCHKLRQLLYKSLDDQPQQKEQLQQQNSTADYIVPAPLIQPIYLLCVDEQIFNRNENYTLIDFMSCCDKNNTEKQQPPIKQKPKFCYILSMMDAINEKTALEHFGIKGYKTQKKREKDKRINISTRNKLFSFTQKVNKLFNSV